eukprot:4827289-Amphidinium_carterae.2
MSIGGTAWRTHNFVSLIADCIGGESVTLLGAQLRITFGLNFLVRVWALVIYMSGLAEATTMAMCHTSDIWTAYIPRGNENALLYKDSTA